MAETLTRQESQQLIEDLKAEAVRLQDVIASKNLEGYTLSVLEEKKSAIQDKLSQLLKKKGLITEDDYNDSYELIRRKKSQTLLDLNKKSKVNLVLGILVLGVVAVYLFKNKK